MKSIFKIAFLFLGLVLMSNSAIAQSTAKVDAMAQTKELQELSKFKSSKFKSVYEVYLKYDRKLESINRQIDASTMSYMQAIDKLEVFLVTEMDKHLTDEEFAIFLKKEDLTKPE
ncbi:hypothetical protein [Aurantibacter sp.]|uniref:hypothetical protein n=1 Tax=Aurantibacter sp. TaxID=2807103 RepID=UPI0035C7E4A5